MRLSLVVILILGFASHVQGILLPKCSAGTGMAKKGANPLGVAKPGECKACADKRCRYCSDYYKTCTECQSGYGFDRKKKCVPCASKDCGVCSKSYKKCEGKIVKCGAITDKAGGGKKVTWNSFGGKGDYCPNKPGLMGNGYNSVWTATISKGTCLDCNGPDFRPLDEGKLNFCDFDAVGRQVAAAAFKAKAGCAYPGSIEFTLDRACVSQKSTLPFFIDLQYSAKYCGETKIVVANGGGRYEPMPAVNPAAEWEWAVKN